MGGDARRSKRVRTHLAVCGLIPAQLQPLILPEQRLGDLQEAAAVANSKTTGGGSCQRHAATDRCWVLTRPQVTNAPYLRRKDKAEGPAHHAANQEAGPEAAAAALRPAPSQGQQRRV